MPPLCAPVAIVLPSCCHRPLQAPLGSFALYSCSLARRSACAGGGRIRHTQGRTLTRRFTPVACGSTTHARTLTPRRRRLSTREQRRSGQSVTCGLLLRIRIPLHAHRRSARKEPCTHFGRSPPSVRPTRRFGALRRCCGMRRSEGLCRSQRRRATVAHAWKTRRIACVNRVHSP